jgi:hypothetical protein
MVMQRIDYVKGPSMPSVSGQKAYEKLFDAKLTASNIEALDAFFTDIEKGLCRQQRRRKAIF